MKLFGTGPGLGDRLVFVALAFTGGLVGANVQPILTGAGNLIFPENATPATISASSGALKLAAGGSNQGIPLLPSGSGVVTVNSQTAYGRLAQALETNSSANFGGMALNTWSATGSNGASLDWNRSKSSSIGTQTTVALNDILGFLSFRGSDGTAFQNSSQIRATVDNTVSAGVVPGRLDFFVNSATGVQTQLESIRVGGVGILQASPGYPLDVTGDINTTTGFRINGGSTLNHVLVGDGTRYVDGVVPAFSYNGHTLFSGTPTINSCGTGSPTVSGVDSAFKVSVGGGVVTSCSINFGAAFSAAPSCVLSDNSTAVTGDISAVTTSSVTFAFSASLGGGTIWAHCF